MKKYRGEASSNLMPLLAAWQQDESFYLLFPWAKTDLRSWWKSNPDPNAPRNVGSNIWLSNLCTDVASGLEAFHKASLGYHGDIKPENILWFPDRHNKDSGKWKIADFGLSNTEQKDPARALERFGCTPAYRAPEYDDKNKPIGQMADIWSLACVFTESAIWCYFGYAGLKNFESDRFLDQKGEKSIDGSFWERDDSDNTIIKPLVHDVSSQ